MLLVAEVKIFISGSKTKQRINLCLRFWVVLTLHLFTPHTCISVVYHCCSKVKGYLS